MNKLWQIMKRRRLEALATAIAILAAGVSAAFLLPPSYRSTATILVNSQEMPQGVGDTTHSVYADRRLKLLTKKVLSGEHLTRLAKQYHLVDDKLYQNGRLPVSVLDDLRKRIDINLNKAKVIDSKTRFQVDAVIAFDISFVDKDPEVAQKVTERLVQLYLQENTTDKPKTAITATHVLSDQERQLAEKVKKAEDRLKQLKESAVYELPEMKDVNIRGLEKANDAIADTRIQLRSLQQKRIFLQSELMRLSPTAIAYDSEGGRILGHEDRLKVLEAEYAQKKAKYSPSHPDLLRLRREIASLKGDVGNVSAGKDLRGQLRKLRAELASLKKRYSPSHPSIKSLKKRISALSAALKKAEKQALAPARRKEADNPAYISTMSKLKSTELDIAALKETMKKLQAEREKFEKRLEKMPVVEREYVQLEREYKDALTEYDAIRTKRFNAELSGSLEENSNNQGLKLLEPANFPEKPYKPNRKLLLLITCLLAGWGGIGVALVREHFDDRIWTSDDISAELSDPPLSSIPDFKHRSKAARKTQDLVLVPQGNG